MSLSKLVQRLRKEAVRNPKKAGVLGLTALVAVYFWAPLIRGWMGSPADAPPATPAAAAAKSASTPATAPGDAAPAAPAPSWEKLVEWINNDGLRSVAKNLLKRPDPFHQQEIAAMQKELAKQIGPPKAAPKPKREPEVDPEKLGFQLSSTMIGSSRRIAMINGEMYREGDTVSWRAGDGPAIDFRLVRVEPKAVTLERAGKRFEVRIPERFLVELRPAGEGK